MQPKAVPGRASQMMARWPRIRAHAAGAWLVLVYAASSAINDAGRLDGGQLPGQVQDFLGCEAVLLPLGVDALGELDSDQWHDVLLCRQVIPVPGERVAHARTLRMGRACSRLWDPWPGTPGFPARFPRGVLASVRALRWREPPGGGAG
jgi:allantoicase